MTLRGRPVEETATLPGGEEAVVRIAVPADPYIRASDLETVALELRVGGELAATLNTLLDPDQESEARSLAREIVARLESGDLEPTAGALEPYAERLA